MSVRDRSAGYCRDCKHFHFNLTSIYVEQPAFGDMAGICDLKKENTHWFSWACKEIKK